jgi:hypothetical protein
MKPNFNSNDERIIFKNLRPAFADGRPELIVRRERFTRRVTDETAVDGSPYVFPRTHECGVACEAIWIDS